jgi:hypothetical protein
MGMPLDVEQLREEFQFRAPPDEQRALASTAGAETSAEPMKNPAEPTRRA